MCFGSPKTPPEPEPPKLPKQPLSQQDPARFAIGRDDESAGTSRIKRNRSRRSLRIMRDSASAQSTSTSSGVNVGR